MRTCDARGFPSLRPFRHVLDIWKSTDSTDVDLAGRQPEQIYFYIDAQASLRDVSPYKSHFLVKVASFYNSILEHTTPSLNRGFGPVKSRSPH